MSDQIDMFAAPEKKGAEPKPAAGAPLAERMRPSRLEDFVGQAKLIGPKSILRRMIEQDRVSSMILWGPPGSGKTTLATVIAQSTQSHFVKLSAVTSTIGEAKATIEDARKLMRSTGRRTILFIDEIHRFNKAQQDAFLPHVEEGAVALIGATTENPSFSVIAPLLSRCRVFTLQMLADSDVGALLKRALADSQAGLGAMGIEAEEDAIAAIAQSADGDARRALNTLELAARHVASAGGRLTVEAVGEALQRDHFVYDKSGEEHYNLISAFHKSVRKSDPDAAVYWLARMLSGGEPALYVARRMIRIASEDVGMADPAALPQTIAAWEAYQKLGSPEGELALFQAAVYLAVAPKSDAVYRAAGAAQAEVEATGSLPAPMHLRNAPTKLMKAQGYGEGYQYDHAAEDHYAPQPCLPDGVKADKPFYEPTEFGFEKEVGERLRELEEKRKERLSNAKGTYSGDSGLGA